MPARGDASCPAAIEIAGTLAPYTGSHKPPGVGSPWWYNANGGKSCCYAISERDRPPNNGGGGSCPTCKCAAAGTPIATPTGEVAIEALGPGDIVLSMHRGALRPVRLVAVHRERVRNHVLVAVRLSTGRTVAMSPEHPTADGTRFAELAAGSMLGAVRVIAVERVPYTADFTYDLLPDSETATYVAAGVLVGSTLRSDDRRHQEHVDRSMGDGKARRDRSNLHR